jgi:hypothetical protein
LPARETRRTRQLRRALFHAKEFTRRLELITVKSGLPHALDSSDALNLAIK